MRVPPAPIEIRLSRSADLDALAAVERAAGTLFPPGRIPDPDDTTPLADLTDGHKAGWLWVAARPYGDASTVVGLALAEAMAGDLYLSEIAVHPEHGGQGVGRRMLETVCQAAAAEGFRALSLTTFADLRWNGPFYASAGFSSITPDPGSPLQRELDAQIAVGMHQRIAMRKALVRVAAPALPLQMRPANPADVPWLVTLRRQTMAAHLQNSGITLSDAEDEARVVDRLHAISVLEDAGRPVGMLKLDRAVRPWSLVQIQLRPDYQGRGLGTRIVKGVMREARISSTPVELSVLKVNPAQHLYARLGFVTVEDQQHSWHMQYDPVPHSGQAL